METIVDFEIGNGCVIMDRHTIKSIYLGENQYGYKEFDNEIVKSFAEYLEKDYKLDLLYKINNEQAKDGKNIANTIKKNYNLDRKVNILLVDDLYRTGNTLRECCKVLKQDENVNNIYCLVMTRTKNK